ncbi:hypothetical protein P691DRAFT_781297, partial [Macrolepiota fuliginosa MF-IS2]
MPLRSDQLELIRSFKEDCIKAQLQHTNLKLIWWVNKNVIPKFTSQFHVPNSTEHHKIYNWFKNNCQLKRAKDRDISMWRSISPNESSDGEVELGDQEKDDGTAPHSHLPGLRALVVEDHKDAIMSKIQTKSMDPLSDSHFFSKWNITLTKFIKNLAPDELLTPTREDVLKWQSHLPAQASNSLWNLLGWKHKQFRDTIMFLSVAIHDPSNMVKVKHNIEDHMDESQDFIDMYDLHCADEMAKLAEGFLP